MLQAGRSGACKGPEVGLCGRAGEARGETWVVEGSKLLAETLEKQ